MQKMRLEHDFSCDDFDTLWRQVADFQLFASHHPYMRRVTPLPPTGANGWQHYRVEEKLWLFGFIPQSPIYEVYTRIQEGKIEYASEVRGLQLRIVWDLERIEDSPNRLRWVEDITVSGNRLFAWVFLRILRAAHLKVMKNMQRACPQP